MVLLIRSIGKKEEAQPTVLDVKEVEEAMQRVLSAHPITVAAVPAPAAGEVVEAEVSEPVSASEEEIEAARASEREKVAAEYENKIAELQNQIAQLKNDLENAPVRTELVRDKDSVSKEEYEALKEKVNDLQARLAEYEIIEDDIADLSMYKEENARLKAELARLKGEPLGKDEPPPLVKPAPKPDRFELDVNDAIMKEFATAVEVKNAPPADVQGSVPADLVSNDVLKEVQAEESSSETDASAFEEISLAGPAPTAQEDGRTADIANAFEEALVAAGMGAEAPTTEEPKSEPSAPETPLLEGGLDTDKILNELSDIETKAAADIGDVLEESLDTEKLLAEMNSLTSGSDSDSSSDSGKASNG